MLSTTYVAIASRSSRSAWAAIRARRPLGHAPDPHHPVAPAPRRGRRPRRPRRSSPACPVSASSGMSWTTTASRRRGRLDLGRPRPHPRVDDRLERSAAVGVGEHEGAQRGPVEVAVGREHVGAELLDHGRQPARARRHDLAGQQVGVDDDRARARRGSPTPCSCRRRRPRSGRHERSQVLPHDDGQDLVERTTLRPAEHVEDPLATPPAARRRSRSSQPPAVIGRADQAGGPAVGRGRAPGAPRPRCLQRVGHLGGRPRARCAAPRRAPRGASPSAPASTRSARACAGVTSPSRRAPRTVRASYAPGERHTRSPVAGSCPSSRTTGIPQRHIRLVTS